MPNVVTTVRASGEASGRLTTLARDPQAKNDTETIRGAAYNQWEYKANVHEEIHPIIYLELYRNAQMQHDMTRM